MAAMLSMECAAVADPVLGNPDPSTVLLLQYKFSRTEPPYAALALLDNAVRSADEFHKAEAIRQADAALRARAAGLAGVEKITVNLVTRFSDYDAQYGEYDFDLNDGTYISYTAFDRQVQIALTNGTSAQSWKLDAKEAEEALRKNKGNRSATLALLLSLSESLPPVNGAPPVLNAKIVSYDIFTQFGNVRLGHIVVDASP